MKKAYMVILLGLLFSFSTNAQLDDFNGLDSLTYTVTNESFQPSDFTNTDPEAVILSDQGLSFITDSLDLYFYHSNSTYIRKSKGLAWAKVELPFSSRDSLIQIKAYVFRKTSDGIDSIVINDESIRIDSVSEEGKVLTLDYEQAQVGDIIQYTYLVKFHDWKYLNDWFFQNNIPTLKSIYNVITPTNVFFYKELQGLVNLDGFSRKGYVQKVNDKKKEFLYENFFMDSIPAYQYEHDVPSEEYFIRKLKFHLSEYTIPGNDPVFLLPASYEELSVNWASDPYFNQVQKRSFYLNDLVDKLYYRGFTDKRNAQSFYYYIRNNFTIDNRYEDKSLQEVFKDKKGTAAQLNLLLAKVLNQAGLDANMVALCTYDNQPVYPDFPHFELFDHFVVLLRTPNDNFFLDASQPNNLFGMLPPMRRAMSGLVVSNTAPGFIRIPYLHEDKEQSTITIKVADSAYQHVEAQVRRSGFNVFAFDQEYLAGNKTYNDYYIETIFENPDWDVSEHEIKAVEDDYKVLKENLDISTEVKTSKDNYMELNSVFFNEFTTNPLTDSARQNPLTIYAPIERTASYSFELPKGWEVQQLPKSTSIRLEDNSAVFSFSAEEEKNKVIVSYTLTIDKVIFMPQEYSELKKFYDILVEHMDQKIKLIKP